ncbi:NADH-ubiquinone oxidoreductase complex I, 21 kDa subunit-domain-containing protein [Entophlyctis helioformis]|nr:NADH-ubiquinone oxidoreductase complex I, 21 kDa subunit-domain-containing protein [Entophlyctis helioformis]
MKWVSNLPDDEHVPYKFLAAEPDIKTMVRYFRPSDYLTIAGVGVGFPAALAIWERISPTLHPRKLPRIMAVQVPFYFTGGLILAFQSTLFRFWGWKENKREAKMWMDEATERESQPVRVRTWSETE